MSTWSKPAPLTVQPSLSFTISTYESTDTAATWPEDLGSPWFEVSSACQQTTSCWQTPRQLVNFQPRHNLSSCPLSATGSLQLTAEKLRHMYGIVCQHQQQQTQQTEKPQHYQLEPPKKTRRKAFCYLRLGWGGWTTFLQVQRALLHSLCKITLMRVGTNYPNPDPHPPLTPYILVVKARGTPASYASRFREAAFVKRYPKMKTSLFPSAWMALIQQVYAIKGLASHVRLFPFSKTESFFFLAMGRKTKNTPATLWKMRILMKSSSKELRP